MRRGHVKPCPSQGIPSGAHLNPAFLTTIQHCLEVRVCTDLSIICRTSRTKRIDVVPAAVISSDPTTSYQFTVEAWVKLEPVSTSSYVGVVVGGIDSVSSGTCTSISGKRLRHVVDTHESTLLIDHESFNLLSVCWVANRVKGIFAHIHPHDLFSSCNVELFLPGSCSNPVPLGGCSSNCSLSTVTSQKCDLSKIVKSSNPEKGSGRSFMLYCGGQNQASGHCGMSVVSTSLSFWP